MGRTNDFPKNGVSVDLIDAFSGECSSNVIVGISNEKMNGVRIVRGRKKGRHLPLPKKINNQIDLAA